MAVCWTPLVFDDKIPPTVGRVSILIANASADHRAAFGNKCSRAIHFHTFMLSFFLVAISLRLFCFELWKVNFDGAEIQVGCSFLDVDLCRPKFIYGGLKFQNYCGD